METKDYKSIIYEKKDRIAYITLNRPEKMNALSTWPGGLLTEFEDACDVIKEDPGVRVAVIKGAGRCFSAGYDINPPPGKTSPLRAAPWGEQKYNAYVNHVMRYFHCLWDNTKPFIAQVHGFCLAGGNDMAALSDLTVASKDAVFGYPIVRTGDTTTTQVWPYILGMKKARELMYTGNMMSADEAYIRGLVNRVVPRDKLEEETNKLAIAVATTPRTSVRLCKMSVNNMYEIMGIKQGITQHLALKMIGNETVEEEKAHYQKLISEKGFKQALEWRDSRYPPTAEAGLRARKV